MKDINLKPVGLLKIALIVTPLVRYYQPQRLLQIILCLEMKFTPSPDPIGRNFKMILLHNYLI